MEVTIKLFVILALFISFVTMPLFSRQDIYFGVRIADLDSKKLKDVWKKYIIYNIALALLMAYLILTLKDPLMGILIPTFAYIFLYMAIYIRSHKEVRAIKDSIIRDSSKEPKPAITVVDMNFTKERKENINVSPYYFIVPLLITLVTVIITFVYYDRIPDPLPIHYNIAGEVDGWADKSFWSVFLLPITSLGMTGLFYFIYLIIGKSKQELNSKKPKTSARQNRKYRKIWSIYTIISSILMTCLFSYMHLYIFREPSSMSPMIMYVTLGLSFIMIVSTLIIGFYVGNGGSKLSSNNDIEEEWEADNTDDDIHWKWGSFYYNKEDPSVFIEKRMGIGWTVNMATWQGKAFIIGTLAFSIIILAIAIVQ